MTIVHILFTYIYEINAHIIIIFWILIKLILTHVNVFGINFDKHKKTLFGQVVHKICKIVLVVRGYKKGREPLTYGIKFRESQIYLT